MLAHLFNLLFLLINKRLAFLLSYRCAFYVFVVIFTYSCGGVGLSIRTDLSLSEVPCLICNLYLGRPWISLCFVGWPIGKHLDACQTITPLRQSLDGGPFDLRQTSILVGHCLLWFSRRQYFLLYEFCFGECFYLFEVAACGKSQLKGLVLWFEYFYLIEQFVELFLIILNLILEIFSFEC